MRTFTRHRRSVSCVIIVVLAVSASACSKLVPKDETLIELGLKDPPPPVPPAPPPRWMIDIVIDAASPAATKQHVEDVLASTVDFVWTQDLKSDIRLWVLDDRDAQLLDTKSASRVGRASEMIAPGGVQRPGEATLEIAQLLSAFSGVKNVSRSPIAEAITKVGLSPPHDRSHWHIVVVTDGVEDRRCPGYAYAPAAAPGNWAGPCQSQFNCAPPNKDAWFKYLNDQRLLPTRALAGATLTFAYFEPATQTDTYFDPPCLSSMAFVQSLQDLWRAALGERAGARVAFKLRSPSFLNPRLAAALPATATKEAP